jgi:TPR repeat
MYLNRHEDALASYDQAISIKSDFADAYYEKSLLKLLLGIYEEGWPLHEWRWKTRQHKNSLRNFKQRLWLGDHSIVNKTILLHAEQGLGDVIQFVRYVSMKRSVPR